jgi:hypothetical protein
MNVMATNIFFLYASDSIDVLCNCDFINKALSTLTVVSYFESHCVLAVSLLVVLVSTG